MERYFKKSTTLPDNFSLDDLTEGLKIAFQKFQSGDNLFITGPAGTGKTYLIQKIKEYCDLVAVMVVEALPIDSSSPSGSTIQDSNTIS